MTFPDPPPRPPVVHVFPPFDTKRALPEQRIVVRAQSGTLSQVLAYTSGASVPGTLDATRTVWRSDWTLKPGSEYTITATAKGSGGPATWRMRSSTSPPTRRRG